MSPCTPASAPGSRSSAPRRTRSRPPWRRHRSPRRQDRLPRDVELLAGADVVRPAQLGALVDMLHARGLHVVAWYLPGFVKPALDFGGRLRPCDSRPLPVVSSTGLRSISSRQPSSVSRSARRAFSRSHSSCEQQLVTTTPSARSSPHHAGCRSTRLLAGFSVRAARRPLRRVSPDGLLDVQREGPGRRIRLSRVGARESAKRGREPRCRHPPRRRNVVQRDYRGGARVRPARDQRRSSSGVEPLRLVRNQAPAWKALAAIPPTG